MLGINGKVYPSGQELWSNKALHEEFKEVRRQELAMMKRGSKVMIDVHDKNSPYADRICTLRIISNSGRSWLLKIPGQIGIDSYI